MTIKMTTAKAAAKLPKRAAELDPIFASIRKPSAPAAKTFLDAEKMPAVYKMTVDGDCLHPLVTDGMMLAFDRGVNPAALDVVAVFLTPEAMGTFWLHQAIVKRLVKPFPRGTRLGTQVAAAGRKRAPRLIVEQLNPFRQYAFRPDQVLAIHACVGQTQFGPHDWIVPAANVALELLAVQS